MRTPRAALVPLLLLAACTAPAEGTAERSPGTSQPPASSTTTPPPQPEGFTLVATGDVLIHQGRSLTAGALQDDGTYDFSGVLAPVAPLIGAADLAICHLETPVAPPGGPYRGYPKFAVQPEIVEALAGAGFDECSTASNHSLDDRTDGLVRTLDALDAAGIGHAGTYRTQAESTTPQILDVHGVKVAHVAGTFGLNGRSAPAGQEWSVEVDPAPGVAGLLAAAARARAAGADVVVASLHCCVEYRHDPTGAQIAAVHALLASPDVDLVLGHHAHVVQPFERIDGEWAAYGLGNLIAQHSTRGYDTEDSVMARFRFTRGADGRFTVSRAEAVPLRIELGADAVRVVPADSATFDRVAEVLDSRGAEAAGLDVVPG